MNIFNRSQAKYPLTEEAKREGLVGNIRAGAYVVLGLLVAVTGFHALMIVLTQTAGFEVVGWTGVALIVLTVFRVAFPLIVELGAGISVVGSLKNVWRGDQKKWSSRIDAAWLVFAACNLVTFWSIERAAALEGWQSIWLNWGMPISGLFVGWLVVVMIRAHPDHKRAEEEAAAQETARAEEFNDEQTIMRSEEMRTLRQRKTYRDIANSLPAQGYTQEEAEWIMGQIPAMQTFVAAKKEETPATADGLINALLNRLGVGNSAHDAARHEPVAIPLAQPAAGQGNGPAGHRIGGQHPNE